jgi:hypothetical protein
MIDGKHILKRVGEYSLVCVKTSDAGYPQWYVWVCKGDPMVSSPDVIATTGLNTTMNPDPVKEVGRMTNELNEQLVDYFQQAPPETWEETIDMLISSLNMAFVNNSLLIN